MLNSGLNCFNHKWARLCSTSYFTLVPTVCHQFTVNTGTKSRWTYDTNGTTMSPVQYTTSQLHLRIFLHSSVSKFYLNDDVMTSTTDGTPLQGPPVSLVSYRPKQNMQVSLAVLVVTGASNTSILAVRARILHAPSLPKPWNVRRFFFETRQNPATRCWPLRPHVDALTRPQPNRYLQLASVDFVVPSMASSSSLGFHYASQVT